MAVRSSTGTRLASAARALLGLEGPRAAAPAPVRLSEPATAREVALRLTLSMPGASAAAGDVLAFGLLDEVARTVLRRYLERVDAAAFSRAAAAVRAQIGAEATGTTLRAYRSVFPAPPGDDGETVHELLLTWLANVNPALGPVRALVDDRPLGRSPGARYAAVVDALSGHFATAPRFGSVDRDLVSLLRAPALAAPSSLGDQLDYVRRHWAAILADPALLDRLLVGIGIIAEEAGAFARRGPGGGGLGGLEGDLFGLASLAGLGADESGLDAEPERYSSDIAWMPELVLIAKSAHVWLDQLGRTYGREIRTLDAVPSAELDRLAGAGVTGLWLIGVWERSRASREIKRRRGNPDALASAYALHDYVVAADLGGEAAATDLRHRAAARGIRLASDMVPNHMGIDARWVVEHPDWFLGLPSSPYPAYSFGGPDLSSDDRVAIILEDHYWDGSDAAVVFKRVDRWTGDERYVYHGNDGTSFPWNDTAQLDYLRADVREAVIQTILHVARQFPVIRFDAAMVLAKRHIERLWHPLPGHGGAIPSRAEHAMTKRAFDHAIPIEFWREVVDRVAAEAPGTLLLAEAFWLMEGYFVRTLGMHRVYNSAFMNLLRDEDNALYRRVMRDTLEFDPQILGRFVNFMSNPDEKTAVEQFGTGDKHFGVATLLATLPGLPMLGHGQLEGFRERYGMEFGRAAWDEPVDEGMLARYEREIVPLLRRRGWFAGARDFILYDVVGDDGGVREDVYAYSNLGPDGQGSLVVYHNRYASTAGRIRESVGFSAADPVTGERSLRRKSLADGLDLWRGPADDPGLDGAFVRAREERSGLEYVWPAGELVRGGLGLELGAYDYRVYLDWSTLRDAPDGRWSRLAGSLGGRGVASLDDAIRDLELAPVHDALRAVLTAPEADLARASADLVRAVRLVTGAQGGAPDDDVTAAIARGAGAFGRLTRMTELQPGRRGSGTRPAYRMIADALADPTTSAALRAIGAIEPLGALGDAAEALGTTRAWFAELRLGPALERLFRAAPPMPGVPQPADPGIAVHRTWVLLGLARPGHVARGTLSSRASRVAETWLASPDVASYLGVHAAGADRWLVAERLDEVAGWALALDALEVVGTVGTDAALEAPDESRQPGERLDAVAPMLAGGASVLALALASASKAGYRIDAWLELLRGGRRQTTVRPRQAPAEPGQAQLPVRPKKGRTTGGANRRST
jgi:glycosidase